MRSIMKCCIILHNMIIEYEREASSKDYETIWRKEREERDEGVSENLATFIDRLSKIKDPISSRGIQKAVMDHLWTLRGNV